jgi:hypothetical protein
MTQIETDDARNKEVTPRGMLFITCFIVLGMNRRTYKRGWWTSGVAAVH